MCVSAHVCFTLKILVEEQDIVPLSSPPNFSPHMMSDVMGSVGNVIHGVMQSGQLVQSGQQGHAGRSGNYYCYYDYDYDYDYYYYYY